MLGVRIQPDESEGMEDLKLIAGLGNPGPKYAGNRHNIGFQCVDLLAQKHGLTFDASKGRAKIAMGTVHLSRIDDQVVGEGDMVSRVGPTQADYRVLLAKPQTFMNDSGRSIGALARFYKIDPADVLVIFDDLDLPLGTLRLRPSGGSGGHRGMKSIIQVLGESQFPRLRVGIDRPPGRMDPADYVLQDFSDAQADVVTQVRELAVAACEHWLVHGITSAMNIYNAMDISVRDS
jgi:PTH1 family peptidyl-tRNA hydrolase